MTGDYDRQIDLIDEFIFQNVQGAPFFGTWCTIFANPGGGHRHRMTTPWIRLCLLHIVSEIQTLQRSLIEIKVRSRSDRHLDLARKPFTKYSYPVTHKSEYFT